MSLAPAPRLEQEYNYIERDPATGPLPVDGKGVVSRSVQPVPVLDPNTLQLELPNFPTKCPGFGSGNPRIFQDSYF